MRTSISYPAQLRRPLTAFWAIVLLASAYSQNSNSASLHGVVHNAQGKAVANAEVQLQSKDSRYVQTTHSDAQGKYAFSGLQEGVYSVRVAAENGTAEIASLFLSRNESKTADLTLSPVKTGPFPDSAEAPKFFDEPHFTVSGVTDASSLGGHGSDTIVRTRETLAKEAASLGKSPTSRAEQISEKENALRAMLQKNPDSFEANYQFGRLLLESGKAGEALLYLEAAERAEPATGDIRAHLHHALAQSAELCGDSLKAVGEYQRAAELAPTEPYYFDWGSELLIHHAAEPAMEVFSKGNQLFPRSVRMLIGAGAASFTRGDYRTAVQRLCAASDLEPTDPAPYVFLGKMQAAESAASPEILERLRRFVSLQPENVQANYYYAIALGKQRRTSAIQAPGTEIESLLNKAVRLDPKFALAHLQLGILHSQRGDSSGAISHYERAVQSDPQLEEAHYRLAQAYRLAGQPDKAQKELRIYRQLSNESAQRVERERHEIRQFVYTLRDRPAADQDPRH